MPDDGPDDGGASLVYDVAMRRTLPPARSLLLLTLIGFSAGCAGTIGRGPAHAGVLDPASLLPEDTRSLVWVDVAAIERWPVARLAREDWADLRERMAALEDERSEESGVDVLPAPDVAHEADDESAFDTFEVLAQAEWVLFASMPGEQEDDADELIVVRGPFTEDDVERLLRSFDPPVEFEAPDALGGVLPFGGGADGAPDPGAPGAPRADQVPSEGPPPERPEPTLEREGRLYLFGDSAAVNLRQDVWVFGTLRRVRGVLAGPHRGLPQGRLRDMWERVDGSGAISIAVDLREGSLAESLNSLGDEQENEGGPVPAVAQHARALGARVRLRGDLVVEAYLATENTLSATVVAGELRGALEEAADSFVSRVLGVTRPLRDATVEVDGERAWLRLVVEEARVTAVWGRIAGIGSAVVEVLHFFSSFMSGMASRLGGAATPPGPDGFGPGGGEEAAPAMPVGPGDQEL